MKKSNQVRSEGVNTKPIVLQNAEIENVKAKLVEQVMQIRNAENANIVDDFIQQIANYDVGDKSYKIKLFQKMVLLGNQGLEQYIKETFIPEMQLAKYNNCN